MRFLDEHDAYEEYCTELKASPDTPYKTILEMFNANKDCVDEWVYCGFMLNVGKKRWINLHEKWMTICKEN